MYSSGGTDDRDSCAEASQPWVERNRDRRQHQRKVIDLKTCPEPRRHHIASWPIGFDDGLLPPDLFIAIRDKVLELLRQRNMDEGQRRGAARVLLRADEITISRYCMSGWMFTWGEGCRYYLAIRERDPLTLRLDSIQLPFEARLRTAI